MRANLPAASLPAAMTDLPPAPALVLPAPVLVVEDEPLVCRRLERLLGQLGYPADALLFAASLAEARRRAAAASVARARGAQGR
ncbi:DNA-binding response regulator, partial [Achromobacter xylosoxidans]